MLTTFPRDEEKKKQDPIISWLEGVTRRVTLRGAPREPGILGEMAALIDEAGARMVERAEGLERSDRLDRGWQQLIAWEWARRRGR